MAEKLKDFTFGRMRSNGASAYDEYLEIPEGQTEGEIWQLSPEDSSSGTASVRSMQTSIANIAKKRGLKIRTNVVTETTKTPKGGELTQEFLVIQAYIPEEDDE